LFRSLLLTFQHRAGVSPYTSPFGLAETCVFGKQSLGPIHCGLYFYKHPFSRSYGVILPSSLTRVRSLTLEFSSQLPVSVYGTGRIYLLAAFLGSVSPYASPTIFGSPSPLNIHACRICLTCCLVAWTRSSFRALIFSYCVTTSLKCNLLVQECLPVGHRLRFSPRLRSRLSQSGRAYLWTPQSFAVRDPHPSFATLTDILTSKRSTSPPDHASPHLERSPTIKITFNPQFR